MPRVDLAKLFGPNAPSAQGSLSGIAAAIKANEATLQTFVLPSQISTTRPTRCGRGMIVPVTGAANEEILVTHNLGRRAQLLWAINNQGGNFSPKLRFGTSASAVSSATQQTIVGDEAMQTCLILFV